MGRLSPSALYFTAFPSGHPLPQAHRSVPHHLPYLLAAKYADSCLLANICRDASGNCILDLHEVLAGGRNNFSSSSEELLTQQTPPLCCSTSTNPPASFPWAPAIPGCAWATESSDCNSALWGVLPLPQARIARRGRCANPLLRNQALPLSLAPARPSLVLSSSCPRGLCSNTLLGTDTT